jgi:hypothetical protein
MGASRSLSRRGLRKVTIIVPEDCAEGLRQFSRDLCDRQTYEPAWVAPQWRSMSPSAELMVAPACGARCAVRDTGATDGRRFHWAVTILGRRHPVAAGRTAERAEARSLAEAALSAYRTERASGARDGKDD